MAALLARAVAVAVAAVSFAVVESPNEPRAPRHLDSEERPYGARGMHGTHDMRDAAGESVIAPAALMEAEDCLARVHDQLELQARDIALYGITLHCIALGSYVA